MGRHKDGTGNRAMRSKCATRPSGLECDRETHKSMETDHPTHGVIAAEKARRRSGREGSGRDAGEQDAQSVMEIKPPMNPEKPSTVEPSVCTRRAGCQGWTQAHTVQRGRGENDHRVSSSPSDPMRLGTNRPTGSELGKRMRESRSSGLRPGRGVVRRANDEPPPACATLRPAEKVLKTTAAGRTRRGTKASGVTMRRPFGPV